MKRFLIPAVGGAVALLLVAAFTLGYHIAAGHAALHADTGAAAPTSATPMTHEIPGVPCALLPNGTLVPFPAGALGNATQLACTVTGVGPAYLSEWRARAPDGKTAEFRVVAP
jgi:hypothetical protein